MRRVLEIESAGKLRELVGAKLKQVVGEGEVDTTVELIQALIPVGLLAVEEALQEEVRQLVGERYQRQRGPTRVRWGRQQGSVYLGDQKVAVQVPRVRDQEAHCEVKLNKYQRLQQAGQADRTLLTRVISGLSCRRYEQCAQLVPAAFGLSASTVSRRYLQASRHHLQALCERRLEGYDLVAIFLDGKTFASEEMVIALGVMLGGEKVILGFVQTATENERVCRGFLRELLERGLSVAQGVPCVIDGAKGLRAAVRKVFGEQALVQRCQWHKRENVVAHLPKAQQARVRRKLQRAYEQSTYAQAKATLGRLRQELSARNESAVRSLDEGLEETLTLHRLGLCEELGDSFKTTNCLESVNAQVAQLTGRVDRWSNSHQMHRWLAMALLDVEPRLRRVRGYRHLSRLRAALQADLHLCHHAQEELLQAAA